jgi:hypothetical protein
MTAAARLAWLSIALGEEAPSAERLQNLLRQNGRAFGEADSLGRLRELAEGRQYRKALKIDLADTSKGHTMRGLLYALLDRRRNARNEFAAALALDSGNQVALRALQACRKTKWWD